jgi:hypothetical protein
VYLPVNNPAWDRNYNYKTWLNCSEHPSGLSLGTSHRWERWANGTAGGLTVAYTVNEKSMCGSYNQNDTYYPVIGNKNWNGSVGGKTVMTDQDLDANAEIWADNQLFAATN